VEGAAEIVETLAPAARMLGGELAARLATPMPEGTSTRSSMVATQTVAATPAGHRSDPVAQRLLHELGHDPMTLDELAARTGQSPATLGAQLLLLELEARVESLPGNRYQRLPVTGDD
jgi:DNA processing protein